MTVVYYTFFKNNISNDRFRQQVNALPGHLRKKITSFRLWQDSLASLYGKLLLQKGLSKFKISSTLNDLLFTEYKKPYIKGDPVSFSISHSGGYVVCVVSDEVQSIGIDVEEIKIIDLSDFRKVWTDHEWKEITEKGIRTFYEYWTKKEALIKADGRGLELNLQNIDVRESKVEVNNKLYYFTTIELHNDYAAHLSSTRELRTIELSLIDFNGP